MAAELLDRVLRRRLALDADRIVAHWQPVVPLAEIAAEFDRIGKPARVRGCL